MQVMTATAFRKNLAAALDAVVVNEEELVIPRDDGDAVVVVDLKTWNSMKETFHVLGDPEQTKQLMEGILQLNAGLGLKRELFDDNLDDVPEPIPAQRNVA